MIHNIIIINNNNCVYYFFSFVWNTVLDYYCVINTLMKFFKKDPIRNVTEAIWILSVVNKFISISPYTFDKYGYKLTFTGITKCAAKLVVYSTIFYFSFKLFNKPGYRQNISIVALVGNMFETIVGMDVLIVISLFYIIQSNQIYFTWKHLERIDIIFCAIGFPINYNKFIKFSYKITIMTLGTLVLLQINRSNTEGHYHGTIGYIYELNNTMPLIVTVAIILQFQCLLFLLRERLTFIKNYLKQVLRHKSDTLHISNNIKKLGNKNRKNNENQISKRYLLTSKKLYSSNKTYAILEILLELGKWSENIKESYSVPVLVSLFQLAITSVFRLYSIIWHFNKIKIWHIWACNIYFTAICIQGIIHVFMLLLLHLLGCCRNKVTIN